jgi:hypothetical protein
VFLLATVASQAVVAATISWISVAAAESHRATLIAFSSTLLAIETMALAGALGGLAQNHSTIWPDLIVLMLAIGAAFASLGAPGSGTRRVIRSVSTISPAMSLQAA